MTNPAVAVAKVRSITEVLDAQPLLDEVTVKLLEWASGYYHHPIGEVMQSALPTLLRRATSGHARGPKQWTMTAAGAALPLDSLNRGAAPSRCTAPIGRASGLSARRTRSFNAWRRALGL